MLAYVIAAGIFLFAFLGSLISPRYFIAVVLASFANESRLRGENGGISFSIQELFTYGFILAFFIRRYPIKKESFQNPVSKGVLAYIALMILSTAVHVEMAPQHMFSVMRDTVVPYLWFVVFLNFILYVDKSDVKKYFNIFIAIGLVTSLMGFLQHFFGVFQFATQLLDRDYLTLLTSGGVTHSRAATGFFLHWNIYGIFLQMPLLIALVYLAYSAGKHRSGYLVASFILLVGEYFSFSRGTYFSLLAAILLGLWVGVRRFKAFGYAVGGSIVALFFLYILPFFLNSPKQLATLFLRFRIWETGYNYFTTKSNWVDGMGPGMFIKLVGTEWDVHNDYLMHLFENGLIGLAALLILAFVLLRVSYDWFKRSKRFSRFSAPFLSCLLIFTGYFTQEFVEHSFYSIVFRLILFTFAALMIRANRDFERWTANISST